MIGILSVWSLLNEGTILGYPSVSPFRVILLYIQTCVSSIEKLKVLKHPMLHWDSTTCCGVAGKPGQPHEQLHAVNISLASQSQLKLDLNNLCSVKDSHLLLGNAFEKYKI